MENPEKKGVEKISDSYRIKESDKREGIDVYGSKPLDGKEEYVSGVPKPTEEQTRRKKEILQRIVLLEKSLKSTNYVGDKNLIEKEIIELENELRKNPSDKKLSDGKIKTAKELAMEGKIAWDKGDDKKEDKPISPEENLAFLEKELEKEQQKLSEMEAIEATKKIKSELEKAGYKEDEIKRLLAERTKNEPTVKENAISKDENKEEKEKYSREELLNAAEIFCKYNPAAYFNKDPKEQKIAEERVLIELKSQHSEREIDAAVKVAAKRNEVFNLKDRALRIKEEYKTAKDNPSADILTVNEKYAQQIIDIKNKIRLADNDYNPLLSELAIANLDSQLKNLEKYRDHADFEEKVQDAELFKLSMIQTEKIRYQDAKVSSNSAINPTVWDHTKNFFKRGAEGISKNRLFKGYARMGKGKRMALSAAMIGAGTALWLPASVAAGASAVAFVGYKMARSLMGGTFGYYLSKKIAQPIAQKAYEHDSTRRRKTQQQEAIGSEEMAHFLQLARNETSPTEREKILQKIADFNIELCDKYTDKIRREKKWFIANNVLGTVAAGLIGGKGAQLTADWLAGPGMIGIFGAPHGAGVAKEAIPDSKGGGTVAPVENPPPKVGVVPIPGEENIPPKGVPVPPEVIVTPESVGPTPEQLEIATVGEGEGIQHTLRRQLEANPTKFGFDGDLNDRVSIRKWSGTQADLISIDQGYKGGGTESWVRDMGPDGPKGNPAYVLDLDASGKPTIQEYFEGKLSGTGGVNSPYEYSHDSPVSQRYVSAVENTPEQTFHGDELQLGKLEEVRLPEPPVVIEGTADFGTTGSNSGIVSVAESIAAEKAHITDVYLNNINHVFPKGGQIDWPEARGLPAKEVAGLIEPGRLAGLSDYLHKLEEVTGLKPEEATAIQSAENVHHYVNRALEKASELGKLEEVRLPEPPVVIEGTADFGYVDSIEHNKEFNSFLHMLTHENLNELKDNIPHYATVLNMSPEEVEHALTELGKTEDIVGGLSKLATEHPEQARLLSKILEAEPELDSDTQAFKNALDAILNSKK